jgi:LysM repeat protein
MPPREEWRRYVAPAAFLLAVTIAVVLVRSGLNSGHPVSGSPAPTTTVKRVETGTTTKTKTTRTTTGGSGKQYWTVQAGDTFGVISEKSGVPVATIEELNPKVSSTSLFIGEKIRIR